MELSGGAAQLRQFGQQNADPFQQRVQEAGEAAQAKLPANRLFTTVSLVSWLVTATLLIVSGIGLLRVAPWARRLAITYAVLSAVLTVVNLVYEVMVRSPAVLEALDQIQPSTAEEQSMLSMVRTISQIGPVFGCVTLIYPIVVLVVRTRPSVRAAFRDEQSPPWERPDVFAR